MFDSLRGRRFTSKCKQAIKCIGMRVAPIQRKNQARVRFLRKDVADLIANGLDVNAFGRIDALFVEMNKTACYDIIQHDCDYIKIQLSTLQKQRECPQEVVESLGTLIFAAARFPDLPELCDLRHLITERYGDHVESYVNAEFVEKMQKNSFPMDKKLHLMQGIAKEYSVTWDSKAFEQKMSNPASVMEQSNHQINMARSMSNMKNGTESDTQCIEKFEATPRIISPKLVQQEPRDIHVVSCISTRTDKATTQENAAPVSTNDSFPPYIKMKEGRKGSQKDDQSIVDSRSPWVKEEQGLIGLEKEAVGETKAASMVPSSTELKTHTQEQHVKHNDRAPTSEEEHRHLKGQESQPVMRASLSSKKSLNLVPPPYYVKPKIDLTLSDRPIGDEHKDKPKDQMLANPKPKPVSVRRRPSKFEAVSETVSTNEETRRRVSPKEAVDNSDVCDRNVSETPNARRRNASSRYTGATNDVDCGEDEERVMDQLLVHYSRKSVDKGTSMTRTRGVVEHESNVRVHYEKTDTLRPQRAASFPVEPVSPAEAVKIPARAASLQPEILSPGGGCVHPRLPDYDDLAARFRAMKKA